MKPETREKLASKLDRLARARLARAAGRGAAAILAKRSSANKHASFPSSSDAEPVR
jgi:hypothetical protein